MKNDMVTESPGDDLLDRAVQCLRQTPVPPGPDPGTIHRVLNVLDRQNKPGWIILKKYAFAASIAATILAWFLWTAFHPRSAGLAFADIRQRVLAAQTVTYQNTSTWKQSGTADPYSVKTRVCITEPGRERVTYPTGQIAILDYRSEKGLELYPGEKKAVRINTSGLPRELAGQNLIETFRDFPDQTTRDLGTTSLNGRTARLFQIARDQITYTVWIDLKTALPIQIEYAFNHNDPLWGEPVEIKIIKSDITFNRSLDPAMFDLTPPAGYTLETDPRPYPSLLPAQTDIVEAFRVYTDAHQGTFPPEFTLKTLTDLPPNLDWESKKFAARAVTFVQILRAQNQRWQYVGRGVRRGRNEIPVFWYQLKDSLACRVLYTDLTFKEMPIDQFLLK